MRRPMKVDSKLILRVFVIPATLVSMVVRKPFLEWIALVSIAVWAATAAVQAIRSAKIRNREEKKTMEQLRQLPEEQWIQGSELALVRQINYRVTEQLKQNYPMVAWLWVKRPSPDEACKGGIWRIRLSNTEPFNFADVEIAPSGKMEISMLQVVPLAQTDAAGCQTDELQQDEILKRKDVKAWFEQGGEDLLGELIDELNTQGHHRLLIKEDGAVYIKASGKEEFVRKIDDFPAKMSWEECCQLLSQDEIKANIKPEGMTLSW